MTLRSFLVDGVLEVHLLLRYYMFGSASWVEYGRLIESTGLILGCERGRSPIRITCATAEGAIITGKRPHTLLYPCPSPSPPPHYCT